MDLFEFLPHIFQREGWKDIPDSIKKKHCFMIQRIMSMKYPLQAQHFNRLNTSAVATVNIWHMIMSRQFTKAPQWTYDYSKTIKKEPKSTDKKAVKRSTEVINMYMTNNKLCTADYEAMLEFFPEEVATELKMLEEYV